MIEEWRVIADFPDYAVSDMGRIKRLTSRTCAKAGTILKQCWRGGRNKGYLAVDLCFDGGKRTVSVHVLVADAFLDPRPADHIPNHRDGDRGNNCLSNLEWATQSQNVKHAYAIGLADAKGERNGHAKLTATDVLEIRRLACGRPGECANLGRRFHVSRRQVADIIKGVAWPHLLAA